MLVESRAPVFDVAPARGVTIHGAVPQWPDFLTTDHDFSSGNSYDCAGSFGDAGITHAHCYHLQHSSAQHLHHQQQRLHLSVSHHHLSHQQHPHYQQRMCQQYYHHNHRHLHHRSYHHQPSITANSHTRSRSCLPSTSRNGKLSHQIDPSSSYTFLVL